MIDLSFLADRPVVVMGLGRSGLAAARALRAGGARVAVWDDSEDRRAEALAEGLALCNPAESMDPMPEMIVWSPGIPHSLPQPHPAARAAEAAGVPLVCDVDLLVQACPAARLVGITGTNGKSTTTSLVAHILKRAGRRVAVGGNLGTPALALDDVGLDGVFVLELSSYQLELTPHLHCAVAVLLNVTPDHLDRHGGMAGYVDAKRRIFDHQGPGDTAVVGIDDTPSRTLYDSLRDHTTARLVPVTVGGDSDAGVWVTDGTLHARSGADTPEWIADLRAIPTLPGPHNWQNAAAAVAVARALGLSTAEILPGLASYPGLPHRQQTVATLNGRRWINDSKATNPDAAARALACYRRIYWIAGGRPKDADLGPLLPYLDRVSHAFLIGEAAEPFARELTGRVPVTLSGTLDQAVADAHRASRADDADDVVVLLSPACASFDQFRDFEARGQVFRRLVQALASMEEAASAATPPVAEDGE